MWGNPTLSHGQNLLKKKKKNTEKRKILAQSIDKSIFHWENLLKKNIEER